MFHNKFFFKYLFYWTNFHQSSCVSISDKNFPFIHLNLFELSCIISQLVYICNLRNDFCQLLWAAISIWCLVKTRFSTNDDSNSQNMLWIAMIIRVFQFILSQTFVSNNWFRIVRWHNEIWLTLLSSFFHDSKNAKFISSPHFNRKNCNDEM